MCVFVSNSVINILRVKSKMGMNRAQPLIGELWILIGQLPLSRFEEQI